MGPTRAGAQTPPSLLQQGVASIFSALFPAECRICGELLENISRLPVCLPCLDSIRPFSGPQCVVCGELLLGQLALGEEPLCGLCQRARPSYERAYAPGPYEGALRDLIHLLKYHGITPAAAAIGRRMADSLCAASQAAGGDALLVPIPLYWTKARQRTFNQSAEIALEAVRASGENIVVRLDLLERVRETKSQTGLTRHQRRENVRGAFTVPSKRKGAVKGRNIILLDDVLTTGTTAEECARVLKRAGAARVWVVTAARVTRLDMAAQSLGPIPMKERETAALGTAAAN